MKPLVLRAHIRPLPEYLPRTKELETAISVGASYDGAWYRSQKENWLGWLAEYNGPGAYGRTDHAQRNAAYIYNHIQCAPMLFWLAEALELPEDILDAAFKAITSIEAKGAQQCAALRNHIPWGILEQRLTTRHKKFSDIVRIKIAGYWN